MESTRAAISHRNLGRTGTGRTSEERTRAENIRPPGVARVHGTTDAARTSKESQHGRRMIAAERCSDEPSSSSWLQLQRSHPLVHPPRQSSVKAPNNVGAFSNMRDNRVHRVTSQTPILPLFGRSFSAGKPARQKC